MEKELVKGFSLDKTNNESSTRSHLANLQNTFKVEMDASVYYIGMVLMQRLKPICYHFEMFHGGVLNYATYGKEFKLLFKLLINGSII